MPESMNEYLNQDMECEGLLECVHGLKALDQETFASLVESDSPLTVDEIADAVGRERSTAHRSIQRLQRTGLVEKEQINYDQGGYYHVFYPSEADDVAVEMQRILNDWYTKASRLIDEFREEYDEAAPPEAPPSE